MKDKYFIIGSNSFSGSNMVKFLLDMGMEVFGISRSKEYHKVFLPYKWKNDKNFKFYNLNINSDTHEIANIINKIKPSYIINFAALGMVAESWQKPEDWYQTNVVGQVKLHDELRKMKFLKKYIHISTPEVYGSTKELVKENLNFFPSTPYAVSRASCDLHLISFLKAYNFPVIFTRAANVYGPGQQLYRIIPRAILYSILKKKFDLHGGGESIRSFIHIDDVSNAILAITKNGNIGQTYHISTTDFISIKDLVKKISTKLNVEFLDLVNIAEDRLGKDEAYKLDSSKLKKELNWSAEIKLEDGLDQTISWVQNNIRILKQMSDQYQHKF